MSFFSDVPSSVSEIRERSEEPTMDNSPPETLRRHHKINGLVLWPHDDEDPTIGEQQKSFLKWWNLSAAAIAIANKKGKFKIQMRWGSINGELGSNFSEAATVRDGQPKLICKRCDTVIVNPRPSNQGNQGMKHHLESKQCLAAATKEKGNAENRLVEGWIKQRVSNQSLHLSAPF